jgi:translocation and assembly module TamB
MSPSVPAPAPANAAQATALDDARARRRARLRWLAVRATVLAGALVLLFGLGLAWLLNSVGGRDVLLQQIVARLPADARLTWRSAEGPASGPLTLHGVRFAWQGTTLVADEVMLDPAVRPLFSGTLRLDALRLRGAVLSIPRSPEPFKLPAWPDSLPDIAPPLPLHAERLEIGNLRVDYAGAPVLAVARLQAGLDVAPGVLHVEHLVMQSDRGRFTLHGDYRPRRDARTNLRTSWYVPARRLPDGTAQPEARLGIAILGRVAAMQVAIAGRAPGPVALSLALRGRAPADWRLHATAAGLDPSLFAGAGPGAPLAFDLRMAGRGGAATLEGKGRRADAAFVVRPSRLQLGQQRIALQPLVVELMDGRVAAVGFVEFADLDNVRMDAKLAARKLAWGGAAATGATPSPTRVVADADLALAGTSKAWTARGTAKLARAAQSARLELDLRGDRQHAHLASLHAAMPTGTVDAQGDVTWARGLEWNIAATLAGLDPQYFVPGWPGAVRGELTTKGLRRADGALDGSVDVASLGGTLRGRALAGGGHVVFATPAGAAPRTTYEGDVDLHLGASHVVANGRLGSALELDAKATPLQLADLWPDAAGVLRGELHLRGAQDAPDVRVDLEGSGLRWGDWRAARLTAKGHLPWTRRVGSGALDLRAEDLQAGLPLDTLNVTAQGAMDDLALALHAKGPGGGITASAHAGRTRDAWTGRLAAFEFTPEVGASWRLRAPANLAWSPRGTTLALACMDSSAGGDLCASADWPRQARVLGHGLPLALAEPWLPARDDGRPWRLRGALAIDATVRPVGGSWQGVASIRSAEGGITIGQRPGRASRPRAGEADLLRYDALAVDGTFNPTGFDAKLGAGFAGRGRVDATLAAGWRPESALRGTVAIATDEVSWLELFSPDIVGPTGHLAGRLEIGGTRAVPRLTGDARLTAFAAEVPALGLALRQGTLTLDALADGSARLQGQVHSGEGVLTVGGTLGWGASAAPLRLHVGGSKVLVSDTRELRAVADPDLDVSFAAGDAAVTVTGSVTIASARIDLERLDRGAQASPDVVVLDPVDPSRRVALGLDLDLALVAGKDVRLKGFGLDGSLSGRLQVRARPGHDVLATGDLNVDGSYAAYGSKLAITRGGLRWSNSPVGDPLLDVRAERVVGNVTAGVDVRGRASAPIASVWTNPASSPSEAIAYLALGRPLASASREEGQRVNAARSALSIGGNVLLSQLGARIGLDDAGVSESRALGSEVIGAGKYLSPRLYVGYGVSLIGSGQVLTLRYLLRKGFDIEIESSTVENRASVNWRKER